MGKAYKCEVTGKVLEGEPVLNVLVTLSPTTALLVVPQVIVDKSHMSQGGICPEAASRIGELLAPLVMDDVAAALAGKKGGKS